MGCMTSPQQANLTAGRYEDWITELRRDMHRVEDEDPRLAAEVFDVYPSAIRALDELAARFRQASRNA